ncbi:hypothetical protein BN946_scf184851.g75 [Trametes cinnabarina]|uniref:Uncharacterized protein n=1 Tax=Pycnoporus cinnabarinus TaxID=5643 RepID=A0A060S5G8_PYCCI|nr:hypothetical protein BN946_scf184851.g75 [Trametes cinnabarina]
MAQPVFDEHPLEEYFRQTGEFTEPMPGGSADFDPEPEVPIDLDEELAARLDIQLPQLVARILQASRNYLPCHCQVVP